MEAMNDFLDDYPAGKAEGRYIDAELPVFRSMTRHSIWRSVLGFCFCTPQLGEAFHRSAIREMCHVAAEVRVFHCGTGCSAIAVGRADG